MRWIVLTMPCACAVPKFSLWTKILVETIAVITDCWDSRLTQAMIVECRAKRAGNTAAAGVVAAGVVHADRRPFLAFFAETTW